MPCKVRLCSFSLTHSRTLSRSRLNVTCHKLKPANAGLNFWWTLRDSLGLRPVRHSLALKLRLCSFSLTHSRTLNRSRLNVTCHKLKPANAGLNFWWTLRDSLGLRPVRHSLALKLRLCSFSLTHSRTLNRSRLNVTCHKLKPANAGLNFWWTLRDSNS